LLVERPVWPVGVVVIGVLAEDEPQMPFTSDQHPIRPARRSAAKSRSRWLSHCAAGRPSSNHGCGVSSSSLLVIRH
jgi:hypothetical protein